MTTEYKDTLKMLQTLAKTTDYLRKNNLKTVNAKMLPAFNQIYTGISTLTETFYGSPQFEGNKVLDNLKDAMDNGAALAAFFDEFDKWKAIFETDLEVLNAYAVKLDYDFHKLMIRVHNISSADLIANQKKELEKLKSKSANNYNKLVEFFNSFSYYWGKLDPDKDEYEHFEKCVGELKEHAEKYLWLYDILADMRSRKVLYGILKFWIDLDFDYKNTLVEKNFDSYFDMDILAGMSNDEVVVDCGAYTGDSIVSYLDNFTGYKKIYAYEMVPSIFEKLKENLKDYENVELHNAAISSNSMSKKKVFISDNSKVSTISLLDPENASVYDDEASVPNKPDSKVPIEMTTIDHEIPEKITFIKMDIEGSETNAIKGGKNHIKIDKPKMAIAAYHNYSDMWDLAEMLNKLNSNYRFYLRYNGASNGYMTSEYVLYAV